MMTNVYIFMPFSQFAKVKMQFPVVFSKSETLYPGCSKRSRSQHFSGANHNFGWHWKIWESFLFKLVFDIKFQGKNVLVYFVTFYTKSCLHEFFWLCPGRLWHRHGHFHIWGQNYLTSCIATYGDLTNR